MPENSLTFRVRAALREISAPNPASDKPGRDLVSAGLISDILVSPAGVAKITVPPAIRDNGAVAEAIDAAVSAIDGIARTVIAAPAAPQQQPGSDGHSNPLGLRGPGNGPKKARIEADGNALAEVGKIVAIASGKGGVGKSTFAVNLAVALNAAGLRVGLLDADIYGPSLPTMLGVDAPKPSKTEAGIMPIEAHGLATMSIGYLVSAEKALAWRGPMVMGAVRQMINDVAWGPLDVMIVDTPPGTGDAHLTLAQMKRGARPLLDGAVIVSTPQELALADVRRGVEFFRKVNAPILGVVENMAWLETADGGKQYLFGEGGAERAAAALGAPFLGAVPIIPELRIAADAGAPPGSESGRDGLTAPFDALAARLIEDLKIKS